MNRVIAIFGLGYVGAVSAGCFARLGHRVVGVDVDAAKVALVHGGRAPLLERGLEALLAEQHAAGRLSATSDVAAAVAAADVCLVCVGTPSQPNGALDLTYVERVCQQIGAALAAQADGHYRAIVIRSTVLPGVVRDRLAPLLEAASGRRVGVDFGLAQNPEFLREGSAIDDFFAPPKTVIGASDARTAALLQELYAALPGPCFVTDLGVAALVKYADNAFHALKVTFANEIGRIAADLGIDGAEVMRIFCEDRKLNISPAYLRPGFAFGGSCLPKDLRAMLQHARGRDIDLPLLAGILPSNRAQVERLIAQLLPFRDRGVGLLGLSFKPGTDDLRESPLVSVVEVLLGRGVRVCVHDPSLNPARLIGSNLRYIQTEIPHFQSLLRASAAEVLQESVALVIAHGTDDFAAAAARATPQQHVFDLVRLPNRAALAAAYHGVAW